MVTEPDAGRGAVFARNAYNRDYAARVAFAAASPKLRPPPATAPSHRAQRLLSSPAALRRPELQRFGAGFDPCAALQVTLELRPGARESVVLLLGQGKDRAQAEALVDRLCSPNAAERERLAVEALWDDWLGAVQVHTPDDSFDVMMNRWLLYQTLACRVWARSGYFQPGGAIGFRDQLQDAMALAVVKPALLRDQLLLAASRQFREGDVQHWWHPKGGHGTRTRCSDDLLFLPYATLRYLEVAGDAKLLNEAVVFLEGEPPRRVRSRPTLSPPCRPRRRRSSCVRADRPQPDRRPAHGLPSRQRRLNDGMNAVGARGAARVFVGWSARLRAFAPLRARGDACARRATGPRARGSPTCWSWPRTASGTAAPLDTAPRSAPQNERAGSTGGAELGRAVGRRPHPPRRAGTDAVRAHLKRAARMILLLTRPFDGPARSRLHRGISAGLRENGGQYTHAALCGDGARAPRQRRRGLRSCCTCRTPSTTRARAPNARSGRVEP